MKKDKRNSFVQLLFVRDMIQHCKNVSNYNLDKILAVFFLPQRVVGGLGTLICNTRTTIGS